MINGLIFSTTVCIQHAIALFLLLWSAGMYTDTCHVLFHSHFFFHIKPICSTKYASEWSSFCQVAKWLYFTYFQHVHWHYTLSALEFTCQSPCLNSWKDYGVGNVFKKWTNHNLPLTFMKLVWYFLDNHLSWVYFSQTHFELRVFYACYCSTRGHTTELRPNETYGFAKNEPKRTTV